ncbi:MAG: GNAT family N-acetyltransferase [Microcoleus sp.]
MKLLKLNGKNSYIRDIGKSRYKVWVETEGYVDPSIAPDGCWLDELDDDTAIYWIIKDGDNIAATARLNIIYSLGNLPHKEEFSNYDFSKLKMPYSFMSRLVVLKDYRGRGIAHKLDRARILESQAHGAKAILSLPAPYRVSSFLKLGFQNLGLSGVSAENMPDIKIQTYAMVKYFL